jgi:hypothetical protein
LASGLLHGFPVNDSLSPGMRAPISFTRGVSAARARRLHGDAPAHGPATPSSSSSTARHRSEATPSHASATTAHPTPTESRREMPHRRKSFWTKFFPVCFGLLASRKIVARTAHDNSTWVVAQKKGRLLQGNLDYFSKHDDTVSLHDGDSAETLRASNA